MKALVSGCQRSESAWCQQYFSWPVAGLQGTQSSCTSLALAAGVPKSLRGCTCRRNGSTRRLFPSGSFSWPLLNPIVFKAQALIWVHRQASFLPCFFKSSYATGCKAVTEKRSPREEQNLKAELRLPGPSGSLPLSRMYTCAFYMYICFLAGFPSP